MQDAFAYCAELVRTTDRDRYLATLFAPVEHRGALFSLYAFDCEVARVREAAREPLPGEIRLQWWSDVLRGERDGEASANPVAAALLQAITRHGLDGAKLIDLIEAHRFDLYDEPMQTIANLEDYARKTSATVLALAAKVLAGVEAEQAAEPAGIASGIAGLLRSVPQHAARRQVYMPAELLARHQVEVRDMLAGRRSPGLNAALADLRKLVRVHLAAARQSMLGLAAEALPAFLPVALTGPLLRRLDRADAFSPIDIPPWRRQWLIWRAARNPARITG